MARGLLAFVTTKFLSGRSSSGRVQSFSLNGTPVHQKGPLKRASKQTQSSDLEIPSWTTAKRKKAS